MIRGNFENLTTEQLNDLSNYGDNLYKLIGERSFEEEGSWDKWVQENEEAYHKANEMDHTWIQSSLYSSLSFRKQCANEGFKLLSLYPMYFQGWECDYWGAIGTKEGKTFVLETSHGGLNPREIDPKKIKIETITVLKIERE